MLNTLNLYLWKFFLPRISQDFFKNKIFSLLAVSYISLFSWPRKMLLHYFFGKGKLFSVNTKELIFSNPLVYQKLTKEIMNKPGIGSGRFHVSQAALLNPNYRYSTGSFDIHYEISENEISFITTGLYRFGKNNSRLTKHLHNQLYFLKERGLANDFNFFGNDFVMNLNEFLSKEIKFSSRFIKQGGPTLGKLLL